MDTRTTDAFLISHIFTHLCEMRTQLNEVRTIVIFCELLFIQTRSVV